MTAVSVIQQAVFQPQFQSEAADSDAVRSAVPELEPLPGPSNILSSSRAVLPVQTRPLPMPRQRLKTTADTIEEIQKEPVASDEREA